MKLTMNPAKARTIFHYAPFTISLVAVAISLIAVGINVWIAVSG